MDGVDAGEAELGVQKARANHIQVSPVHLEELSGQVLPVCLLNWRVVFLTRQKALFIGDIEVAL